MAVVGELTEGIPGAINDPRTVPCSGDAFGRVVEVVDAEVIELEV
jgi:hypothetical protein